MKNWNTIIISSLTLFIGIAIGRFTAVPSVDIAPNTPAIQQPAIATEPTRTAQTKMSADTTAKAGDLAAAAKTVFANKDNQPPTAADAPPVKESMSNNNSYDDSPESAAKKYPNEITSEEIDRVLPAPFNESFKRSHGFLREKYKDFVANTQPNDWDIRMQNKMTDFIFSNPYAKFLTVESLLCKSGLCEIRVFETKEGSWGLILSEMQLQDWWDIGGYHSAGNGVGDGRMAYHVLLPRKKVTPST